MQPATPGDPAPSVNLSSVQAELTALSRVVGDPRLSLYLSFAACFVLAVRSGTGDVAPLPEVALPRAIDLLVIATKLKTVQTTVRECWKEPQKFPVRKRIGFAYGWIGKARARTQSLIDEAIADTHACDESYTITDLGTEQIQ